MKHLFFYAIVLVTGFSQVMAEQINRPCTVSGDQEEHPQKTVLHPGAVVTCPESSGEKFFSCVPIQDLSKHNNGMIPCGFYTSKDSFGVEQQYQYYYHCHRLTESDCDNTTTPGWTCTCPQ